ncbi:hypothetical protein HanIR_Chr12g0614561 [Helianthus annuus]|nr:hypothetical protein HanIR_Chr12g0614561 [Helianthus annuus]
MRWTNRHYHHHQPLMSGCQSSPPPAKPALTRGTTTLAPSNLKKTKNQKITWRI